MPPVFAAVGAWVASALGAVGITVSAGVAAFIGETVVLTASSIGLGFIERALIGKPKLPDFSHDAQSQTITARQAVAPRRIVYGRARLGGVLTFIDTTGSNNEFLQLVITTSGNQVNAFTNTYADGVALTFNGSGDCTAPAKFAGLIHAEFNLGTSSQAAFAGLITADGAKWTSNHRQRGCSGAYIQLKWDQNAFPNGVPNITFDIQGALLFDPRSSTTVYSENPALAIRDYLTNSIYGLGCATSEIDDASFISAANTCDESVSLRAGGSETRYTCNGAFETSQTPVDTLKQLLSTCAGYLVYIGGKWSLYAGVYRTPISPGLTDDDFTAPIQVTTRLSKRDLCNSVKGVFVAAINNWQPSDFPAFMEDSAHGYGSDQWLIEDQNERIFRDITLPFTISSPTAQRLAKIELERTRRQIVVKCKTRLTGYQLQPADVVNVTHSRFGWSNKTFEVQNSTLTFDSNANDGPQLGVELVLRETDSSVYSWTAASDELADATAPTTTMPNPQNVVTPTSLALSTVTTKASDGRLCTFIQVTWTAPADQFVTNGGKIWVQYRVNGTSPWQTADVVDGTTTKVLIDGLNEGIAYDVRIWSQNVFGSNSAVVEQDNFTLGSNTEYFTGGTIGNSVGKNLLGNPGFESNISNTPIGSSLAVGANASDEWYVDFISAYHAVFIAGTIYAHGGANGALLRLNQGVSIPSGGGDAVAQIFTKAKIPVSIGDIVRLTGWCKWVNDTAIPAGIDIWQRISLFLYDGGGSIIGEIFKETHNGALGFNSWIDPVPSGLQASLQVPATIGGGVPAMMRVGLRSIVRNSSGSTLNTGVHTYADLAFDDIKIVLQATPFDLTPTSTTMTITGGVNPLSQSGTSTTINVAASTWQSGDGQISYNSGTCTGTNDQDNFVYGDDPTYSGGAITYSATLTGPTTIAAPGRLYFGLIHLLSVGGGATGTGGGTGGGGPKGKANLA
jgi:hypothetical protein